MIGEDLAKIYKDIAKVCTCKDLAKKKKTVKDLAKNCEDLVKDPKRSSRIFPIPFTCWILQRSLKFWQR